MIAYDSGARQLLGLHAHFLTTGRVPKGGIPTQGPGYHVLSKDPKVACYEGHWIVQISEMLVEEAAKATARHFVKKAGKYLYENLLKDSLEPILQRRPSSPPPELRTEPVLPGLDRINTTVFNLDAEQDYRWKQLRERTTIILPNVIRPVGRSADSLIIIGDNLRIATVDAETMTCVLRDANDAAERRAFREAQISEAVSRLPRYRSTVMRRGTGSA